MPELHMTTAEFQAYLRTGRLPQPSLKKLGIGGPQIAGAWAEEGAKLPPDLFPRPARKASHEAGRMNRTEARYLDERLRPRIERGELLEVQFEAVTIRLADGTTYTPDFLAVGKDVVEIHEVKGPHVWEDGRVKWKVAAERCWWWKFFFSRWDKGAGTWRIEEYGR